jgi:hypothetical protein
MSDIAAALSSAWTAANVDPRCRLKVPCWAPDAAVGITDDLLLAAANPCFHADAGPDAGRQDRVTVGRICLANHSAHGIETTRAAEQDRLAPHTKGSRLWAGGELRMSVKAAKPKPCPPCAGAGVLPVRGGWRRPPFSAHWAGPATLALSSGPAPAWPRFPGAVLPHSRCKCAPLSNSMICPTILAFFLTA